MPLNKETKQTDCFIVTLQFGLTHEILEAGIETQLTHMQIEDSTAQLQGN